MDRTLSIPAQSVPYPLNVVGSAPAPATPTLTCPSAPVTMGTPATFTVQGTDPSGTSLRYGMDWVASGSVNEWVPASGYIPSGTRVSVTHTWGLPGTYPVRALSQNSSGAQSPWSPACTVTVTPPPVTGSLTLTPPSCTIPIGASTCSTVYATWTTSGATAPALVDGNTGTTLSTAAQQSSPGLLVWVAYPQTVFDLKDGGTLLDTKVATASCAAGSTWDGSKCAAIVSRVDGTCSSPQTHYACLTGTSINNVSNSLSWTWSCQGSGGGSTASCAQAKPGGSCSGIPAGTLTAAPNRVSSSKTSITLDWSLTSVASPSSCSLTKNGTLLTPLSGIPKACSTSGSYTDSSGITSQTTYTLVCSGTPLAKTIVNVTPGFREF